MQLTYWNYGCYFAENSGTFDDSAARVRAQPDRRGPATGTVGRAVQSHQGTPAVPFLRHGLPGARSLAELSFRRWQSMERDPPQRLRVLDVACRVGHR